MTSQETLLPIQQCRCLWVPTRWIITVIPSLSLSFLACRSALSLTLSTPMNPRLSPYLVQETSRKHPLSHPPKPTDRLISRRIQLGEPWNTPASAPTFFEKRCWVRTCPAERPKKSASVGNWSPLLCFYPHRLFPREATPPHKLGNPSASIYLCTCEAAQMAIEKAIKST